MSAVVVTFPKPERDRLIESGMYLVEVAAKSIARRLPPSFDIDDLIQEGYLGLIEAADTWEPAKGPFLSRARFIVNARILDSVRRRNYVANTMAELVRENGKQPSDAEAANGCERFEGSPADEENRLIGEIDGVRERRLLAETISEMTGREAAVLANYYLSGCQITDAAAALSIRPARASQLHHEGLRELSCRLQMRGIVIEYSDLRAAVVAPRRAA